MLKRKIASLLLTNKSFRLFQAVGIHVTPIHYYSPIPDYRELNRNPRLWDRESEMVGVSLNEKAQLEFMEEIVPRYREECLFPRKPSANPHSYYSENGYFGFVSAAAMHSIVRHWRPKRIIEIGAGHSTKVLAHAVRMNL